MEKSARKELVGKLLVQIKATLSEVDQTATDKISKTSQKSARKLVEKFSKEITKLGKSGKKALKKANKKAKKDAKLAEKQAAKKAAKALKPVKITKQDVSATKSAEKPTGKKAK